MYLALSMRSGFLISAIYRDVLKCLNFPKKLPRFSSRALGTLLRASSFNFCSRQLQVILMSYNVIQECLLLFWPVWPLNSDLSGLFFNMKVGFVFISCIKMKRIKDLDIIKIAPSFTPNFRHCTSYSRKHRHIMILLKCNKNIWGHPSPFHQNGQ